MKIKIVKIHGRRWKIKYIKNFLNVLKVDRFNDKFFTVNFVFLCFYFPVILIGKFVTFISAQMLQKDPLNLYKKND